jgi:hypothetical protein
MEFVLLLFAFSKDDARGGRFLPSKSGGVFVLPFFFLFFVGGKGGTPPVLLLRVGARRRIAKKAPPCSNFSKQEA